MKRRAVHWLWLFALGAVFLGVNGCSTNEPENASVRPWDSPQSWESGSSLMNTQRGN